METKTFETRDTSYGYIVVLVFIGFLAAVMNAFFSAGLFEITAGILMSFVFLYLSLSLRNPRKVVVSATSATVHYRTLFCNGEKTFEYSSSEFIYTTYVRAPKKNNILIRSNSGKDVIKIKHDQQGSRILEEIIAEISNCPEARITRVPMK
ncbi:MAG: hypothetical protein NC115_10975 [Bacteroidales bacterium]|nr:hypothetical protein [Bacteroidales bacterium]